MVDTEYLRSMDLKTPRNALLSAFYKRSFAYETVKHRMPVIITQTIDGLVRNKDEIAKQYGEESREDLKSVLAELSKLNYEIQTNKPLRNITTNAPDVKFYNDYLSKQATEDGYPTYFNTIWLLAECYMYRRIREAFELTKNLTNFDPFRKQKEEAYHTSVPVMKRLGEVLLKFITNGSGNGNREEFEKLLKLNLWGNKCDLSLSNGKVGSDDGLMDLGSLEPDILCDHSLNIWNAASDTTATSDIIDIVFDNSGYEVFTDLCLADYLISKGIAKKIRLYVKTIPWFISDVMTHDLNWTLNQLQQSSNEKLQELGKRWTKYMANGTWSLVETHFWTLPVDFSQMSIIDPDLYKQLAQAKLVIFKGDLNYRKLMGEKNWDTTTTIDVALQGFHPSKLCTLRTVKADVVIGLPEGVSDKLDQINEKWKSTGKYGVIQFCDKIKPL